MDVGIVGRAGSGKTTLARSVLGILPSNSARIESGEIWFDGRDLLTIPALSQDDDVILRQDSAKLFLWDSIFYIKKSARPALRPTR